MSDPFSFGNIFIWVDTRPRANRPKKLQQHDGRTKVCGTCMTHSPCFTHRRRPCDEKHRIRRSFAAGPAPDACDAYVGILLADYAVVEKNRRSAGPPR